MLGERGLLERLLSKPSREEILEGSIFRVMLRLGVPVALSEMVHTFYEMADIYWLGRLGRVAVAAPSASFPFIFALIAAAAGLMASGTALVSQYKGAGDFLGVRKSVGQVFTLAFIGGIGIGAIGVIVIPLILSVANIPGEVLPYAVQYSKMLMGGMVFIAVWEAFRAVVSASGDTITPMKLNMAGAVINMVIDPILILGLGPFPSMGVAGAALATVLSRAIMSLASLYIILRGTSGIKLETEMMRPDKKIIKLMIKIGLPLSASWVGEALGFSLLVVIMSMEGSIALAAWGIGDRPINIIHFLVIGIVSATAIMIGQSLGAEKIKRAGDIAKKSIFLITIISLTGACIFTLFRYHIASFFISDPQVINAAAGFLLYMSPALLFFEYIQLAGAIGQGSGHTKPVMVISLLRIWVLRNILAYYMGPGPLNMGINGLWLGMAISNVLSGLVALMWILYGGWKKPVIKD